MEIEFGTKVVRGKPGLIGMDVQELRALLAKYKLPTNGNRADLGARINDAIRRGVILHTAIGLNVPAAVTTVVKPKSPPVTEKPCLDWHLCVQKGTQNGYDVLIIPENTLLFKGVNIVRKPQRTDKRASPGSYFADRSVAAHYAFGSDMISGEQGKVITYRTTKPVYVLDMTSINNYRKLHQFEVPKLQYPEFPDIISYTFGYRPEKEQLQRYSDFDQDEELVQWLCGLNLGDVSGYGYLKLPGFHSEIMICNWENKMELYPLEYRFVTYYNTDKIIETWKGEVTGKEFSFEEMSSPEIKVRPKYSMYHIYNPTKNPTDSFLCKEPFVSLRRQHLIKYADNQEPYHEGDEHCK